MGNAVGVITVLGASALIVQKVVSFVRRAFDANGKLPTYTWNVLSLVLGVAYCLGWQVNLSSGVTALIPALANSSHLAGTSGQVLTGLAVGAAAGFWYAIFQALEATVHKP